MEDRSFGERADATLEQGSVAAERALAYGRAALITAMTVRSVCIGANWGDWATFVVVMAFSGYVLHRARTGRLRARDALWTVAGDAALITAGLGSNVFLHVPSYRGILLMPDVASLAVTVATAGFRLNVRAAALGWLLGAAGALGLFLVDRAANPEVAQATWSSLLVLELALSAVGAFAVFTARRSRKTLMDHARAESQRDRARSRLTGLLRQSHDARSTLASALLNAELLERALPKGGPPRASLERLVDDLRQLEAEVRTVETRALEEVSLLKTVGPVDVPAALVALRRSFRHEVPEVRATCPDGLHLSFAGGEEGFVRALRNLLDNARTGSSGRGARTVDITITRTGERAMLVVRDDGPGFEASALSTRSWIPSSKETGSGLGLGFVLGLVVASGGSVELANAEAGGAEIRITLPVAASAGVSPV